MKRPWPNKILAGLLLLVGNASVAADTSDCSADSGPTRTSLLELYTSEACSSCPPADRWLSSLLRSQAGAPRRLVPLAFHVDYWNRLGWVDRFAKPAYSARQYRIAEVNRARTVYTPQFVLDGRDWRPTGSGYPETRNQPAAAELHLKLHSVERERLEIHGQARLRSPVNGAQVFLALYENDLTSRVEAGENAGQRLRHDYVVRELAGPLRIPASGMLSFQHRFALDGDWKRAHLGVSAFVQSAVTGEVYQALQRPACRS